MKTIRHFLFTLSTLCFMNACYYTEKADLLIHNAKIYTVDGNFTVTEAMAVKEGKIIDIGPNNELKNRYDAKETLDAKNRPIYPGFIDAHCHFLWYGNSFFQVDLTDVKSWEEAIEKTLAFSNEYDDLWIVGNGWDQNKWENQEFPNKERLDQLFPDRAVFLKRIDQHAAIANQKALDIAGIDATVKVDGGVIETIDGELSGLLIDNAIGLLSKAVPPMNESRMREALLKAEEMCFAVGLTSVNDAMLENNMANTIDSLQQAGELQMNIHGMLTPSQENKDQFLKKGPYVTEKLRLGAFKYFADGALGSRGAKLKEEYSDEVGNKGLFLIDSIELLSEAKELFQYGFQMNTHCIGDEANRRVLNIYGEVLQSTNDRRWRIEHAQMLNPDDFELFKKYTIIPSVQPTHAISDMDWVENRLGQERLKTAYAYKQLLDQNGILALGTDFPIEDIDPLLTFYAATVRKKYHKPASSSFQAENAISKEEALKGMTIWAAISSFEENRRGSLEIGKVADFIILNQDILKVEDDQILETKVENTFVGGVQVYQREH